MNSTLTHLEQDQIRELLVEQIRIYDKAMPIAESLSGTYDVSPERQQQLAKLDSLMEECSRVHAQMKGLLGSTDPKTLSVQIREAANELATQMERLIPLVNQIEERAQQVKQRLYPEMKESIRAKKMHAAYGNEHQRTQAND